MNLKPGDLFEFRSDVYGDVRISHDIIEFFSSIEKRWISVSGLQLCISNTSNILVWVNSHCGIVNCANQYDIKSFYSRGMRSWYRCDIHVM